MADNKIIKDGLGGSFSVRMRDIATAQDGSLMRSMILASPYPPDYGSGGCYQHCAKSALMAPGLAASSPIYSFWWPGPRTALVNRVRLNAYSGAAGFTAGLALFDCFFARQYTQSDGGGTPSNLAAGAGRLRSNMIPSMATVMVATAGALTVGVRTLDPDPLDTRMASAPTTANTPFFPSVAVTLFEKMSGEHPLILGNNEGFVVNATVPLVGTWQFKITTEWDEVDIY